MNILLPTLHVRRSAQAVPLAAATLKAALPPSLRDRAILIDLFPEQGEEQMADAILTHAPDLVALPLYLWNRKRLLRLCRELKKRRPGLILIGGGPEATADPLGVLAEGPLDGVIRGEGEATFAELAASLARGEALAPLSGVSLADGREGPERAALSEPGALPSPWLSGVLAPNAEGGVLWEVSRGCPFSCDYCYDARGEAGVRHFPLERLEAELDLFASAGATQVWVLDSTFNFPPERGRTLLELMARKAPHIHFHLEGKAEFLDKGSARMLAGLNCSLQLGLQSARPEVLKNIHRSIDPEQFARHCARLNAEGVIFGLDLIYGLPGDDHEGFRRSVDFALARQPNHLEIFRLALLPGTPLHRRRERFGLKAAATPPYEVESSADYSAADLEQSRRLAAANHLFYNCGRAVGFFAPLARACALSPAEMLEAFSSWAIESGRMTEGELLEKESWPTNQVLDLQLDFAAFSLARARAGSLVAAAQDLILYHYHYAEALLGAETLPASSPPAPDSLWKSPLRVNPAVRLVAFRYEILDLLQVGEADLARIADMFRPVGSTALFLRRGEEVLCESLEEEFRRLLLQSDGRRTPQQILGDAVGREEGEEMVAFAVGEGLLLVG